MRGTSSQLFEVILKEWQRKNLVKPCEVDEKLAYHYFYFRKP